MPKENITTEIVHVVTENGSPNVVIFKSKNGGSIQLYKLTPVAFDEVKFFLEQLSHTDV